jgi:hypothetical protein
MTAAVIRFPLRRIESILIVREFGGDGWLALVGSSGWLFRSRREARVAARWLANNFSLPVREVVT